MTREEFLSSAWASFVDWASRNDEIVAQFESETGERKLPAPRNQLERMIDEACGAQADMDYAEKFMKWVTVNHWGLDEAPESVRKQIEADLAPS